MSSARHLFIPGHHNNFHPHLLHSKRAFFYSLVFITIKAIIITAAFLVPHEAYLMPDVLQAEANRIAVLTNATRSDAGLPALKQSYRLVASADAKANDMIHNNYFSHTGPDGHTLEYFLHEASYPYAVAGENLAMGFTNAESVMAAWHNSPTHQANLVDSDFKELGVAIETGSYRGEETVFMVQHFGAPSRAYIDLAGAAPSKLAVSSSGATIAKKSVPKVLGETSAMVYLVTTAGAKSPEAVLDRTVSHVYWQTIGNETTLLVRAKIFGSPKWAHVSVSGISIELAREATSSPWFVGKVTVPHTLNYFFKPVTLPTITVVTKSGATVRDAIDWYNIQVPQETPLEQYLNARDLLPSFASVFAASRAVYFGAILLFSLLLLLTMAVRFRTPQYRLIFQTLFMLVLLTGLWWM